MLVDKYKEAKKNEVSQKNVAEKMIEEASLRLKNAVKKKEFNEIQIAQAMLEGAQTLHKEYKLKEEVSAVIQKKIEKRKSNLISSFIEKKNAKIKIYLVFRYFLFVCYITIIIMLLCTYVLLVFTICC